MKYGVGRLMAPLVVLALVPALFLGLNAGCVFAQEKLDREVSAEEIPAGETPKEEPAEETPAKGTAEESAPTEFVKIPYSATALTLDGETVSLEDFEGKLVFLTVWRTDCKACLFEIPILNKLQEEFAGEEFTVVGLSMDRGRDELVKKVIKVREINYPIWMGYGQSLSRYTETPYFPTLFTIGPEGEVLGYMIGAFQSYEHAVAVVKEARLRIVKTEGAE